MNSTRNTWWPEVRLGQGLSYTEELIKLDDLQEYITITVKRRHGGLEPRERLFGHQIKTKKQFRLIPGAFLISRVQCWHQAYAIVPEDIPENMIASQNYDQFIISADVDPRFFWWFSHSPLFTETVRSSAFGVVIEKMVFNRETWLDKRIPLPPLEEQRRIVSRVEELAARVNQATKLRDESIRELPIMRDQAFRQTLAFEHRKKSFEQARLGDLCSLITDGTHQTPRYVDDGMPFLSAQNIKPYRFMPEVHRKVSMDDFAAYTRHTKPEKGDVLMTRVGAMIGEAAIINRDMDFAFYVSLCLMKPRRDRVYPPYLVHWLNSPFGVAAAREKTLGKGHSQGNLNLKLIREFRLPLPPVDEQMRIAARLDDINRQIDAVRTIQSETAAELKALMPSILDKAFRGEL